MRATPNALGFFQLLGWLEWILLLAVVVGIGIVVILVTAKAGRRSGRQEGGEAGPELPYIPRGALFTPAERSFLAALETALGPAWRVYGKVRLADVLDVGPGLAPAARTRAFNRIAAKHVDFVLCDAATLDVLAVVELDDRSHAAARRQQRDAFLEQACAAAPLPLLRIPAQASYSIEALREQLRVGSAVEPPATTG